MLWISYYYKHICLWELLIAIGYNILGHREWMFSLDKFGKRVFLRRYTNLYPTSSVYLFNLFHILKIVIKKKKKIRYSDGCVAVAVSNLNFICNFPVTDKVMRWTPSPMTVDYLDSLFCEVPGQIRCPTFKEVFCFCLIDL